LATDNIGREQKQVEDVEIPEFDNFAQGVYRFAYF
jgi:hypothetical protein